MARQHSRRRSTAGGRADRRNRRSRGGRGHGNARSRRRWLASERLGGLRDSRTRLRRAAGRGARPGRECRRRRHCATERCDHRAIGARRHDRAADDARPDAADVARDVRRRQDLSRRPARRAGRRTSRSRSCARSCTCRAGGRVGRCRRDDARDDDAVRQGPRAVRSPGRQLPGRQAPAGGHDGRRRGSAFRVVVRRMCRRRAAGRADRGCIHREGGVQRRALRLRRERDTAAWRHRLHVGSRCASLFQARPRELDLARQPSLASRAHCATDRSRRGVRRAGLVS